MAVVLSAGVLLYRSRPGTGEVELLLGHLGGPFWARRDAAAWSIPKGELLPGETAVDAARREFEEELGLPAPLGEWLALGEARQRSGKLVAIWAVEGDLDPADADPGTFEMEWPRGSGQLRRFAEIDRVAWFGPDQARDKLVLGQRVFVERLAQALADRA